MYSESNTFSRFDIESHNAKKRKQRSKLQKRERSLDVVENTLLIGDAKIKQKILDKYSKSNKQKQFNERKNNIIETVTPRQ